MPLTRRELCKLFGAAMIVQAPTPQKTPPQPLGSNSYDFSQLPVRSSNGAQFRDIFKGKSATGELIEVHETTLPPGGAPHPPHHHVHSEMWLVREGTLEFTVNGKTGQLGPGSAGFASSNEEHGVKNPGGMAVTYFVVAVGPGAA
jgi:mannose-6-phosphate isomerase-like protein (cupin superfamily)